MKKIILQLWPFLILIIFVIVFFENLFYPNIKLIYTPDFGSSDIFHFNYALKDFLSQSLKKNQWPLWSDFIYSGFPVLAEGQIGTFNIVNLILYKFLPTYLAFNLTIITIFLTVLIGQFLYLKTLKISNLPAISGAISLTFSAYFITKITHINHIQAASFIPLILFFLEKFLERPKMIFFIAIILLFSQQIFSGYPMMIWISLILVGTRLTFYIYKTKNIPRILFLFAYLLITGLLIAGLSAIQLLPQMEYLRLSNLKTGFSFQDITQYNYHFKNLLTLLSPYFIGNPVKGTYNYSKYGIYWENSSFLGLIPLVLALLSLVLYKKRVIKYHLILLFISILLSFGQDSPFYFIFTIFPFNLFRVPSRYLVIGVFALSILSSLFLESLKKKVRPKIVYLSFNLIIILITFYQLKQFYTTYHQFINKDVLLKEPEAVALLKKDPQFSKVIEYGGSISWQNYFNEDWHKSEKYLYLCNFIQPNSSLIWHIPSANAYFTQWPLRFLLYQNKILNIDLQSEISLADQMQNSDLFFKINQGLRMAGVSHFILPIQLESKTLPLTLISTLNSNDDNIFIYKITHSLPKYWFAGNYKLARTIVDIDQIINSPEFDYQTTVILEKPIDNNFIPGVKPNLKIIQNTDQKKVFDVNKNPQNTILVVNQSFYPGWQAYIGNNTTEVLAANLNQQAIIIPPGDHIASLIYQPQSFTLGKKISLISLLILFALTLPAVSKRFQNLELFGSPGNNPNKFSSNKLR